MTRSVFAKDENGVYRWYSCDRQAEESASAFVHQDSFKPGLKLRHPVTGEIVDNHTRWNQINREQNCRVVGNDLLSKQKRNLPDRFTDELVIDRIHKAESILNDPSKRRAYYERQRELQARNEKIINGS